MFGSRSCRRFLGMATREGHIFRGTSQAFRRRFPVRHPAGRAGRLLPAVCAERVGGATGPHPPPVCQRGQRGWGCGPSRRVRRQDVHRRRSARGGAGRPPPQPAFARNAGPELWAMLLEKAYAKCYGSYSAIAAGDPGDALTDLTGAPHRCFEVPPPKREDGQDVDDDGLYSRLLEFDQQGYAMCAAARSDPDVDLQADVGIVEEHAYGLIKVVRTRAGDRLLQLRNPWGQVEWKGDWSDRSDKWTPGTKRECGWSDADNGAFFMCWEDFRRVFGLVYVLFFHQGWQAKFESTTFDAGKACCMVDLAIFERMGMRLTLHQRRDPPPIGLRFSILDKTSRWPVGGSSQAFKAASTICSEEMMLSPGTYRVRVEVYPEHAARLPHELVLSAYCEKPGEAVLTDVEEDDAFPFCLPGFEDRCVGRGMCGTEQ
eukprot:jgi/Mesvir1/18272/Mv09540-RA.3